MRAVIARGSPGPLKVDSAPLEFAAAVRLRSPGVALTFEHAGRRPF